MYTRPNPELRWASNFNRERNLFLNLPPHTYINTPDFRVSVLGRFVTITCLSCILFLFPYLFLPPMKSSLAAGAILIVSMLLTEVGAFCLDWSSAETSFKESVQSSFQEGSFHEDTPPRTQRVCVTHGVPQSPYPPKNGGMLKVTGGSVHETGVHCGCWMTHLPARNRLLLYLLSRKRAYSWPPAWNYFKALSWAQGVQHPLPLSSHNTCV